MPWADLKLRIRSLFSPRRAENDLDDELQFHLTMQARKNCSSGMDHPSADHRAALEFGNMTYAREACRDQRGLRLLETITQDIRYALRGFRRSPASPSLSSPPSPSRSASIPRRSRCSTLMCCARSPSAIPTASMKSNGRKLTASRASFQDRISPISKRPSRHSPNRMPGTLSLPA